MLIGAHVSIAGGLVNAVERGVERESDAIQIFNQSPRAWRPNVYSDDDVAEFRTALDSSRIESVAIHAVYLINCASEEDEIRDKSLTALKSALALGYRIGAIGVVLHPGAQKGRDYDESLAAVGEALSGQRGTLADRFFLARMHRNRIAVVDGDDQRRVRRLLRGHQLRFP